MSSELGVWFLLHLFIIHEAFMASWKTFFQVSGEFMFIWFSAFNFIIYPRKHVYSTLSLLTMHFCVNNKVYYPKIIFFDLYRRLFACCLILVLYECINVNINFKLMSFWPFFVEHLKNILEKRLPYWNVTRRGMSWETSSLLFLRSTLRTEKWRNLGRPCVACRSGLPG